MSRAIIHKRGDDFSLSGKVRLNGAKQPIVGWTVSAQLQKQGKLVAALVATITDPDNGAYSLHYAGSQATWPIGELQLEIQYTNPQGEKKSTPTASVIIERGVV